MSTDNLHPEKLVAPWLAFGESVARDVSDVAIESYGRWHGLLFGALAPAAVAAKPVPKALPVAAPAPAKVAASPAPAPKPVAVAAPLVVAPVAKAPEPAVAPAPKPAPNAVPGRVAASAAVALESEPAPVIAEAPKPAPVTTAEIIPLKAPAKKAAPKPDAATIDPAGMFDDASVTKTEPAYLAQPDGAADDLKKIKGVGATLERLLNDLGIWHYRQIANLTPGEIAWINSKIDFKGRVQRDKWVSQARALIG